MSMVDKNIIRKDILNIRDKAEQNFTAVKNEIIFKKLLNTSEFNLSKEIFTYVSVKNEVNTINLINYALSKGKKIAVPKVMEKNIIKFFHINNINELREGAFNLLEPTNSSEEAIPDNSSLMIIPGIAFDKFCNRLGYGGGYYDRYLSTHNYFKSIALAYSFQIIDNVPIEKWDIKPDLVITESNTFAKP